MTKYGIATRELDAVFLAAPATPPFQGITVPTAGLRPTGTPFALSPDSSV
jgi:hypothetical protein